MSRWQALIKAMRPAEPLQRQVAVLPVLRGFVPIWLLLASALLISLAIFATRGIAVSGDTWQAIAIANALALGLIAFAYWRGGAGLTRAAATAAVFLQMPAPLAFFSYAATAAGAGIPLFDTQLAAVDAAMGVNWSEVVRWFNQSPTAIFVLERAYHGTILPILYALVLLALLGRTRAIIRYYLAVIGACLACSFASGLVPSIGAYLFHRPDDLLRSAISADAGIWHLQQFEALRAGTFRVFDVTAAEGLVTFPSFHTAAALAVPLALRGLGIITWIAWAITATIVVSTVPIGGHYVIDVLAGALIMLVLHRSLRRFARPRSARTQITPPQPALAINRTSTHAA